MNASLSPARDRPVMGIVLKVCSVAIFVAMTSSIKAAGQVPAGQIVFYRSFFAFLPLLIVLAWQGQLATALVTRRPVGHLVRGLVGVSSMGAGFFALTRLPLPEAITLSYAQPLLIVAFSAIFLGEAVRAYRWTAVAVGMAGVIIISWPNLTLFAGHGGLSNSAATGVLAALLAALLSAIAYLLVRNLVQTERSTTIVTWFSLSSAVIGLMTMPFGWIALSLQQTILLIAAGICGGAAQIFMTEAYRHAEASTVAPFEYTSIVLGVLVGYFAFGDVPTIYVLVGGAIVCGAGIFIIWREHQLGLQRTAAAQATSPKN